MNISQITDYLYVSGQPHTDDALLLEELNVSLIISMVGHIRPPQVYSHPPFQALWLRTYDTFLTPISMKKLFHGVEMALPIIENGGRVLAHCHFGRHRGVAMAAAILIAQGHSATEAMATIKAKRPIADPDCWYIKRRIEKFERQWQVGCDE